jgi:hypothetical protein
LWRPRRNNLQQEKVRKGGGALASTRGRVRSP